MNIQETLKDIAKGWILFPSPKTSYVVDLRKKYDVVNT